MSGRRKKFKAAPPTKEEIARVERKEIEKARILVSIQQARDEVTAGKRLINLGAILHIICSCGFSRETIVACSTCKDLWEDDFHLQQIANKTHRDPQGGGSMNRVSFCLGSSGHLPGTRNANNHYYLCPTHSASRDALVAARLQRLIAAGATVNRIGTGYYSRPPLGLAIGRGMTECVRLLCSLPGLEVNTRYDRRPMIVMAVATVNSNPPPNLEIVRILLAMPDIDVNMLDEVDGSSALSVACQRAHPTDPAIVRMLLEVEGVDVNIGSPPPLCHAVKTSNNAVFELLTSRPEIDPNTTGDSRPLVLAIESKNENFVNVLLSLPNIDINAISLARIQDRHQHYGYYNVVVQTTPLMAACKNVDLPIVRLLLAREGILINAASNSSTALIQTCETFTSEPDRLTLLQFLLEQPEIDVNLRVGGVSPLSAAAAAKDKGAFMLLMQQPGIVVHVSVLNEACKAGAGGHGDVVLAVLATPNLFPEGGYNTRARTLAHVVSLSCHNNHRDILSALLPLPDIVVTRHDIMSVFRMGNGGVGTLLTEWEGFSQFNFSQASLISCLYQQMQSVRIGRVNSRLPLPGCIEILKGLIRRTDFDVEASYDQAEYACLQGYHNAVAAFVAHPAYDINHVRKIDGATLVTIAAGLKLVEVVRVLVAVPGIDLNIKDDVGKTAIYYANLDTKGQTPVQVLLVSHGAVEDDAPDGRSRRGRVLKAVKR